MIAKSRGVRISHKHRATNAVALNERCVVQDVKLATFPFTTATLSFVTF